MNYSTIGGSKKRGNILSVLGLFKPEGARHIQSRKSGSNFLLVSSFVSVYTVKHAHLLKLQLGNNVEWKIRKTTVE